MFMHSVMHSHKYYMKLNTLLRVTAVRLPLYLLNLLFSLRSSVPLKKKKKKNHNRNDKVIFKCGFPIYSYTAQLLSSQRTSKCSIN